MTAASVGAVRGGVAAGLLGLSRLGGIGWCRRLGFVPLALRLLEFLDRLAEPTGERRKFAAPEQEQDNQEDDQEFTATKTEYCQRKRRSTHVG